MRKEVLYHKIAKIIEAQILSGTLRIGDKLPSLRSVQKIHGISLNTAKQTFLELESKSLIESRARSGYYVSISSQRKLALPSISKPDLSKKEKNPDELINKIYESLNRKDSRQFSLGIPDDSLLPIAKLSKGVIKITRDLGSKGLAIEPAQGNENLRRSIAKWALVLEGKLTGDDFVTTPGTMSAIFNCLTAVTKSGDTIAVESPVYFGILQLAKSMGLYVIELPTDPVFGVDIDALKKIIHKVNAVCLVSNFNNPMGSLMPDATKIRLVEMLTFYNVPLIEDDLFGNLYFGASRPKPCKIYDEAGIVMWCGGISKTLAPGYRIGWVAPGKFKNKIISQKLLQMVSMPSLYQEVIADFMEFGGYDQHLRKLRQTLHTNCLKYQRTIEDHFPANTKISQPQGGFFLWLELDERIDTAELYDLAIEQKLSYAPGRMFTQHDQFNNCMRLNFALQWDDNLEDDLRRLGQFFKKAL